MESIPLCYDVLILTYTLQSNVISFKKYNLWMLHVSVLKDHHQEVKCMA